MKLRLLSLLLSICALTGCMYRLDVTQNQEGLIGEWRLKTDAYIIRYADSGSRDLIACVDSNSMHLPDWNTNYTEDRFGSAGNGVEIVRGLPRGSIISVSEVIEDHHATMGVSYHPYALLRDMEGKPRKVDLFWYYHRSRQQQELNPDWAVKIRNES